MSDQNPPPPSGQWPEFSKPTGSPPSPPLMPQWPAAPPEKPLGADEAERAPVTGVIGSVEAILRQPRRVMFHIKQPNPRALITALLIITGVCSLVYGIVVGTFSGQEQLWAAPVKVVLGLMISALICLPSLYIFSCLGGSQARLIEVFGLLAGLLALMSVLLIGFAPVAWVFSQSTKSEAMMGAIHLAFWFIATFFGLRFLHMSFRHFHTRSYAGLAVWSAVFLLVALQMTTALRPIIGRSNTFLPAANDKKFFVGHWMDCISAEENTPGQTNSTAYR